MKTFRVTVVETTVITFKATIVDAPNQSHARGVAEGYAEHGHLTSQTEDIRYKSTAELVTD